MIVKHVHVFLNKCYAKKIIKKKLVKQLHTKFGNIKCNQTTYKGKHLHCDTLIRRGVTHLNRTVF